MIAASLLFGLALAPIDSIAANAKHEGYRNNDVYNTNKQQGNRHTEKNIKHQNNGHHNKHAYADHRYHVARGHHRHNQNKHRNHYHRKPHYAVNNHRHPDRFDLQIGFHAGNFDIVVRD